MPSSRSWVTASVTSGWVTALAATTSARPRIPRRRPENSAGDWEEENSITGRTRRPVARRAAASISAEKAW
jgi:hypothetical protein